MKWETALWMVASLLFASLPRGQPDTMCHAFVGETVILPCTTTSPGELILSNSMLYWQIDSVLVHFFHNGQDSLELQDQRYHGRTSLFLDQMKHGNFSLKLSNVQLLDTAVYTCIYRQTGDYPNKPQKSKIKLIVSAPSSIEEAPSPSGHSQISSRSPADAPCLAMLPLSFHLLVTLGVWHL
ncbi:butyrophilin-like protein 8 [Harpia harpyja]|uniref:butyrophilin-like protein 8 n=1 Tax=Harpia harpyja TaxID=202280 RepID=UPI0022B0DD11|nr:butyrophilin-like protein 8 [Harpia harpyja]XP_052650368.1 butyrophilin-like protein 8 [Harpia harpyja]XP_052650369.1 butyrophilin-like protein 8 [Harpia harpyja]XP_052650370.1 butyrophilin-like protein 8 [Harpia harpyja]XP_052650371.1 butyrophilin-like protein 8 [Harpia harpyja]